MSAIQVVIAIVVIVILVGGGFGIAYAMGAFSSDETSVSKHTVKAESAKPSLPDNINRVSGLSGNAHDSLSDKNQTPYDCHQKVLNSNGNYVAWGYRTDNHPTPDLKNTCFLYKPGFTPFNGDNKDKAHVIGCLKPGEKVEWGCMDVDTVYGYKGSRKNNDFEDPEDNKNQTPQSCREKALKNKDKYVAWGYRTHDHNQDHFKKTCFLYKKLIPFKGEKDNMHITGCMNPGEKVEWGCKTQKP